MGLSSGLPAWKRSLPQSPQASRSCPAQPLFLLWLSKGGRVRCWAPPPTHTHLPWLQLYSCLPEARRSGVGMRAHLG